MATASLVPVSLTDANANVAAGAFTDIDNTIAAPSGVTLDSMTNGWTGGPGVGSAFTFGITDAPGDFSSFNSIQLTVRARVTGGLTDDTLTYRTDISGTNAPTNVLDWVETDDGAGLANRTFTNSTVTPSAADITGWIVRVFQNAFNQTMAPDGLNFEIDEIELILDYNASAGPAKAVFGYHQNLMAH